MRLFANQILKETPIYLHLRLGIPYRNHDFQHLPGQEKTEEIHPVPAGQPVGASGLFSANREAIFRQSMPQRNIQHISGTALHFQHREPVTQDIQRHMHIFTGTQRQRSIPAVNLPEFRQTQAGSLIHRRVLPRLIDDRIQPVKPQRRRGIRQG